MDAGDLCAPDVVGGALGLVGGPGRGRLGQEGDELGKIHSARYERSGLFRRADNAREDEREQKSGGGFHSEIGPSVGTRLTLTRRFVKTRSVWRSKWLVILIVMGALAVRLVLIDQPFIDPWSWRQSDVAAIARNFFESGFRFAWPQIDWAGNQPGYVGTEFPILPFAAALFYKCAGIHEWIGRAQGVLFFVAALPFFFLLVRKVCGQTAAIWATFFYAFAPLSIVASRAFMPDIPSLSLAIAGIYFFLRWQGEDRLGWLVLSAVLVSLALLIKLPTEVIGAPLFYLTAAGVYDRRNSSSGKVGGQRPPLQGVLVRWELWFFAAVTLIPSAIWYWHARRIAENFYPYHFFGGGGFRIMNAAWYGKIAQQTIF